LLGIVRVEQQVLNCVIQDPELVYRFDRDYFVSSLASDLFYTFKSLYEEGLGFSTDNIIAWGNERNSSITKDNIERLKEIDFELEHFESYYKSLRKNFAKNEIEHKLLKDTLVETSKKGELDINKLDSLVSEIQTNIDIVQGRETVLIDGKGLSAAYEGELIQRSKGMNLYSTGDSYLDHHLPNGFPPGQITIIFGATGVGKSVLGLNLFDRQIKKKIPSLYISPEMDKIATMDRLIAKRLDVPQSFLFPAQGESRLDKTALEEFRKEKAKLEKEHRFFFVDEPNISMSDVEFLIQESKRRIRTEYLVVMIDLLTMVTDIGETAQELETSMNRLSAIAKRNNVHIVGIVQANRKTDDATVRSIEHINNLRPTLNNIKNSHAFSERSRLVLGVFRPLYYMQRLFPDDPRVERETDILQCQILKSSQGRVGQLVQYVFEAEKFSLKPYVENSEDVNQEETPVTENENTEY